MPSSKDYILEIVPPVEDKPLETINLIKFTIKNRRPSFIDQYRTPLLILLVSLLTFDFINIANFYDSLTIKFELNKNVTIYQIARLVIIKLMILAVYLKQEPQDNLIVLKDLGIQLISKKPWKFQNDTKNFIPLNNIIDLVIHEGFLNYGQVVFYLCILTRSDLTKKNENVIKVVFPELLPRKDMLIEVWRLSRQLLFGSNQRHWRRVPGQGLKQIN